MVRPNKFNQRPPAPPEPPPPYKPALFEAVDPGGMARFKARLITKLTGDHDASLVRALIVLRECRLVRLNRTEQEIQDYRQALIERFGLDHDDPGRPGDRLLEALYHAADGFNHHLYWARGRVADLYYGPPDYVFPPRHPLPTRR
jgi:hypothetical protein